MQSNRIKHIWERGCRTIGSSTLGGRAKRSHMVGALLRGSPVDGSVTHVIYTRCHAVVCGVYGCTSSI